MTAKARSYLLLTASTFILLALAAWFVLNQNGNRMSLDKINDHLDVGGIQMGMTEDEVLQRWGQGQNAPPGFGGYGWDYPERMIRVSFSNDSDNDLYRKVGQSEFTNADYSLFGVRIGDQRQNAVEKIAAERFKAVDYSPDIFVNGEYNIMLSGSPYVEEIKIWFSDKDLRDRSY